MAKQVLQMQSMNYRELWIAGSDRFECVLLCIIVFNVPVPLLRESFSVFFNLKCYGLLIDIEEKRPIDTS